MNTTYAQIPALRNSDLATIAAVLRGQRARAIDVVAPAKLFTGDAGHLALTGAEPRIDDDGVTPVDGRYQLTRNASSQLADMLGIPGGYAHRMLTERPPLWSANVNGWLEADPDRLFLLRLLIGEGDVPPIVRAVLSPRYRIIDNLDVLLATLQGIHESGASVDVTGVDLTEQRMHVRVSAPGVAALAPNLLRGYRSPFNGRTAEQLPLIFAGFAVTNSDTGNGAASITPRLVVQVCDNGMTISKDAARTVHLGGRLEEGVVKWSDETQAAQLEVIKGKAKDAVATFLSKDYVEQAITDLEREAGVEISNPAEVIKAVAQRFTFTEEQAAGILDHFIKAGQVTAGGVMQAITSYAQTVDDGDTASDLERVAVAAMELAAAR